MRIVIVVFGLVLLTAAAIAFWLSQMVPPGWRGSPHAWRDAAAIAACERLTDCGDVSIAELRRSARISLDVILQTAAGTSEAGGDHAPSPIGYRLDVSLEPEPAAELQTYAAQWFACSSDQIGIPFDFLTETGESWTPNRPPPAPLVSAAEAGDDAARFDLGFGYVSGFSDLMMQDAELLGSQWLARAAEAGHVPSKAFFGLALVNGLPFEGYGPDEGRDFIRQASMAGHSAAMAQEALLGPREDEALADYAVRRLNLDLEAAAACDPLALTRVALRIYSGRGLPSDRDLALDLMMIAQFPGADRSAIDRLRITD